MTSQLKIDAIVMSIVGLLDGLTVDAALDALAEARRVIRCGSTVSAVAVRDARDREIEEEKRRELEMSSMLDESA